MSDIAKLGFEVNTADLKKGEKALDSFAKTGEQTEARTTASAKKVKTGFSEVEKAMGRTASEAIKLNTTFDKVSSSLERQIIELRDGKNAARDFTLAQSLGLANASKIPKSIREQIAALDALKATQREAAATSKALGLAQKEAILEDKAITQSRNAAAAATERLTASHRSGAVKVDNFVTATKKSDKAMAQFSRRSGQAGIQFQQFIGQIQGGQGVMLALSQQSADLGFVLGAPLLGAIAGISASLIGLLIPNLIDTTSSMQDLDKAMGEVNKTATDTDGIKAFTKDIAALAKESEKSARLIILASEQSAREAGRAAAEGIGEEFNDAFDVTLFQNSFNALKTIAGTAGAQALSIRDEYRELGEQFGLTGLDAEKAGTSVLISLRKMELAVRAGIPDAGEKIIAFQEKLADLAETSSGKNKVKLLEFVNSISEYITKAKLAAEMTKLFNDTLKGTDLELVTDETNKLDSAVTGISKSLQAQIIALRDGEEAAIRFGIAQRLELDNISEIPQAIQEQINAVIRLKDAKKEAAQADRDAKKAVVERMKELGEFKKLTKEVENFGGAWSNTGSIIVDAFGDISDSINDYMKQLETLDSQQSKIDENRKKEGADLIALNKLEQQVNNNRVLAELDGLKSLSSASSALFKEKTTASKAFAALNKIIAIAEIALSFQKIAAGTAETGVHVANETTKQGANALTAITSAFAAPFPVGFVAGAAMIAVMASLLGGSFGGGSGGADPTEATQAAQGTGTVLGSDEKSQSILDSQERFEDISIDQLSELRGIRDSINALSTGISQLAISIIGSAGAGVGEFTGKLGKEQSGGVFANALIEPSSIIDKLLPGGLLTKAIGSLLGSTKKTVIDQGVLFISQSLGEIIDQGVVDAQAFFTIKTKKKKLFGLSKSTKIGIETQDLDSAITEQMGAIFGHIGDTVLESVELLGFEGKLQEKLKSFTVDLGKVSFEGLSGEEIEKELQAIFSQQSDLITKFLVPGIAEFQQIGEGLFDTLVRVTKEQVIFNDSIKQLGFDLSDVSNVIQIDIAQSLIGLTGGLENFTDLTQSFFDNFFTEAEQFAALERSLVDVFDSLGLSVVTSRMEFRSLIESIDITTDEGQSLIATLLEINPALSDYIDELENVEEKRVSILRDSAKQQFGILRKSVALEKQRARALLDVAKIAHKAELDRISDLRSQLNAENELRKQAVADSQNVLSAAFNTEMQLIQDNATARINALSGEKSALDATASAMRSLVSNINGSLGLSGSQNLISALAGARRGEFGAAQSLDVGSLTNLDPGQFSSAEALNIQQAINQNRLATIGGLAGQEATKAETAAEAIGRQIMMTQDAADKQVEQLNEQLNLLLDIDTGVLSIDESIANFMEAQADLDKLNFEGEIAKLDLMLESADEVFALHEQGYADEMQRLDNIIDDNEKLLNVALGINNSVLTVNQAIIGLNEAIAAIPAAITSVSAATSETANQNNQATLQAIKDELKDAREEDREVQMVLVRNSTTSARALQQFKLDGMDTRNID